MNVLLTSVGRRAYMVKYFQEALCGNGLVHVCNCDDMTVAFQYADKSVISPMIYSEEYIPFLLQYCKENKIDIVLSLFDIDLYMLSKHKQAFSKIGTKVIVSDEHFVGICNDKWKTYLFLKENNFLTPKTYLGIDKVLDAIKLGEITYPMIVKPRFGCGSIGISVADNEEELSFYYRKILKAVQQSYLKFESSYVEEKVIFQEYLIGQEYGADIINDLSGEFQNVIIKRKIAMRSGETDIAETVDREDIFKMTKRLGEVSNHIANLDCDLFDVDGSIYILELNARFGGGYPFSHIAGCNLPKAIIQWSQGEVNSNEILRAKIGVTAFKELFLKKK